MNTKQRLTELLRTKITNRLNEMNDGGPNKELSDHLSPGIVHLIQDGVHHSKLFPTVPADDGSLNALNQGLTIEEKELFKGHVNDVSEKLERIHADGRLARITIEDHDGNVNDITHQSILHELVRNRKEKGEPSNLARHLMNPENIRNFQVVIEKYPMIMDRYGDHRSFTSRST